MHYHDGKFNYVDGTAARKHITVDKVRYNGKETNIIEETAITGLYNDSYL